jgi:hypothetical protein
MKSLRAFIGVFAFLLSGFSLLAQENNFVTFDKLCGSWQYLQKDQSSNETWQQINDSLYTGLGVSINESGDTVFIEKLRIYRRNGHWIYGVSVADQNQANEKSFVLKPYDGATWYFENPKHDFPQKICYTLKSPDELFAWIEGKTEQGSRREYFHFERIK